MWLIGVLALVLLPLGVVPLLGYAIEATREARREGPPPWRFTWRLLRDGIAVLVAIGVIAAPFTVIGVPIASVLRRPELWHSTDGLLGVEAAVSAALLLALPWGLVMLALMPHAVARYARTGSARDLFDYAASLRSVRRDFARWNVTIAAIVTAWALGLACIALFCAGLVPGTLYAILVSAHATAALDPEDPDSSAR